MMRHGMPDAAWSIPARAFTVDAEAPGPSVVQPSAPAVYYTGDVHRPLRAGHNRLHSIFETSRDSPLQAHTSNNQPDTSKEEAFTTLHEPLPVTPHATVPISKRSSWSRFVAYEACVRVCLKHLSNIKESGYFLVRDCDKLAGAFGLRDMFLKESHGIVGDETGVIWEDTDAAAPAAVSMIPVAATASLKVTPLQVKSVQAAQALASARGHTRKASWLAMALGSSEGYTAANQNLYINVRAVGTTEKQGAWTVVGPSLAAQDVRAFDVAGQGLGDDLLVEVHTCGERVAWGTVNTKFLWQVANQGPTFDAANSSQHKLWKHLFGYGKAFDEATCAKPRVGNAWVEVFAGDQSSFGHVLVGVWLTNPEGPSTGITDASHMPPVSIATKGRSVMQITNWQVYDLVLDAALAGDGCGASKLQVGGEWAWLLNQVASHYGIKDTYQRLAHVNWLVSADIYTMTGPCLELLFSQLELLKQSADTGSLLPREELIYAHTVQVVENLIAQVFECYFTAGDAQGIGGMGQEGEAQAAVLRPAVELFKLLKDCNNPADREWLCDRLRIAAHRQYNKLAFNAEQEQGVLADGHSGAGQVPPRRAATAAAGYESAAAAAAAAGAVQSYRIVDVLCDKVQAELTNDCHLAARGLLPAFVNLPLITASEYCKELNQRLTTVLAKFPPAIPSNDAVDLLVSVGRLQRYLDTHGLSEGAEGGARIDANRIFGKHVRDWFAKSKDILLTALRTHANVSYVTTSPKQLSHQKPVSPIVNNMQQRIKAEAERYERVVSHWPMFGPMLEAVMSAALRETITAVCKQCGLVQANRRAAPDRHAQPSGPGGFVFDTGLGGGSPAHAVQRQAPALRINETILLNSLCQLLTFIPSLDGVMHAWLSAAEAPSTDETMRRADEQPAPGAQFAEVVVELRTKYGAAVAAAAEQLSGAVFQAASPRAVLQHMGLTAPTAKIVQQMQPVLGMLDQVLGTLSSQLESRVFVSCCRGLWDFTAREVYEYVASLQQGKEHRDAWRGKQSATGVLEVVDTFFKQVINRVLGSNASAKDLDAPYHADKCHKLLADNTAQINMAFTVY